MALTPEEQRYPVLTNRHPLITRGVEDSSPLRLLIVSDAAHIDDIGGIPHGTITEATLILSIIEDGSVRVLKDRFGISQGVKPGSWIVAEGARDSGWQVFPEEAGR